MVPIKLWIFWFESKQITNQKPNYIYIYIFFFFDQTYIYIYILFIFFMDKVGQNIHKF